MEPQNTRGFEITEVGESTEKKALKPEIFLRAVATLGSQSSLKLGPSVILCVLPYLRDLGIMGRRGTPADPESPFLKFSLCLCGSMVKISFS